jgi:hypothetical protein
MNNIKTMISGHNKSQLSKPKATADTTKNCNCQKSPCPMDKNCQADSIIYQAEVTTEDSQVVKKSLEIRASIFTRAGLILCTM